MSKSVVLHATNDEYKGNGKPYVARINGLGGKFGLIREFLTARSIITEPGIYEVCNIDKKGNKDIRFFAVTWAEEEMIAARLKEETALEIIQSGRKVTELAPKRHETKNGVWKIRGQNGLLLWKPAVGRDELMAERDRLQARLSEIDALLASP